MKIFQIFLFVAFITIIAGNKYLAEIEDDKPGPETTNGGEIADEEPGPAPELGNDGNDGEDFKWRWVDGIGKAVFKAGKVLTG